MSVVSRFVAFSCSFWLKIYSESTLYMSFKQTFEKKKKSIYLRVWIQAEPSIAPSIMKQSLLTGY